MSDPAGSPPSPEPARAAVERWPGAPPSPWETPYGFSRIVRAGGLVILGGLTSATEDGVVVGVSPYEQMAEILRKLAYELGRVGVGLDAVVQVRCYVTDISRADEVGQAHAEVFADIRPAMTMVEVSGLIDPRMVVEVEALAAA